MTPPTDPGSPRAVADADAAADAPATLRVVLGDQLAPDLSALRDVDPDRDVVWMAEVPEEIEYVPSHRLRIAVFLSAMHHARDALRDRGLTVWYHALEAAPDADADARGAADRPSFTHLLGRALDELRPERVVLTRPGDARVLDRIREAVDARDLPLELREDDRFLCPLDEFDAWAEGRTSLVLEDFYRWMRRRDDVLLDDDGEPRGGRWNFDEDNRETLKPDGPGDLPPRPRWELDATDRAVVDLVDARWDDHPGTAEHLDLLPRTPDQAREALDHFVEHHLPDFGTYQDALWSDEPFLHHSRLSVPLNLGLLDPRACLDAALDALDRDHAPINAVEGFIRQILGWREFVRGIYWREMPGYADRNALDAERDVPAFLWNGDTDMECVAQAMRGVVDHAYAHHIQRLMVLGLFALLYGTHPGRLNEWHLAMYADAVDQISLPNVLGMSQYADGGLLATKPYCASGRYIQRMSDHCRHCPYDPAEGAGEDACPFTTLYWDFLDRHEERLRSNHRMGFQYRNVDRKREKEELQPILDRARWLKGWITRGERI